MNNGERCNKYFLEACELADYPDFVFVKCRKILEVILKDFYCESVGIDQVPNNLKQIQQIRGKMGEKRIKVPRVVEICFSLVQEMGNFGAHDQDGSEMEIDRLFSETCLAATQALINWKYPLVSVEDNSQIQEILDQPSHTIKPLLEYNYSIESNAAIETTEIKNVDSTGHKTIRVRLREFVEQSYKHGDEFKIGELKRYFGMLNPDNSPNAIHGHITMMTTNLPSRLSHKPKKDGSDDLLFRVSKGIYRRYDKSIDPEPIMPQNLAEQEWTSRLLILNASKSLDSVKNSRCYLSPDTGGGYKYSRAAFVGLYKDKAVRYVGEIIGKVVQETKDSEPYLDWLNDEEIPEDTLVELALEQIDQRWDTVHPVKALIFGQLFPVEFKKDTKGGMFRNNLSLSVEKLNHTSGEELARSLTGLVYSNLDK